MSFGFSYNIASENHRGGNGGGGGSRGVLWPGQSLIDILLSQN